MSQTSESEIARKGFLTVNLPILIIIFGSWYGLMYSEYFSIQSCAIISGIIGWIYWEFAIDKWILWALSKGPKKKNYTELVNRIYYCGMSSE